MIVPFSRGKKKKSIGKPRQSKNSNKTFEEQNSKKNIPEVYNTLKN